VTRENEQPLPGPDDPLTTGILFTDQYQLTMAQLYYRMGLKETRARFDHFFRSYPDYGDHQAGYCVNCGMAWLLAWMRDAHFTDLEIERLRGQSRSGVRCATRTGMRGQRRGPGGADFTSNVGISHLLGFEPMGTHAHSMVQAYMALGGGELEAFRAYAEVYPDDCLLLVDTIDTLESGLPNAIRVFEELVRRGHDPVGIRLDSGDLALLSIRSAKMLDEAGFPRTRIILSNQLDEMVLTRIISRISEKAPLHGVDPDALTERLVYGVGTRLITSAGDPALDGVYKLVSVEKNGAMVPAIKISEAPGKTTNPGDKQVWRLYDRDARAAADMICLEDEKPRSYGEMVLHHPVEPQTVRRMRPEELGDMEPLLEEVMREGRLSGEPPTIDEIRTLRDRDLQRLESGVRRVVNPHLYQVYLSAEQWKLKQRLIEEIL
jgi:nicotinate phosphoribosyltransferase